MLYSIGDMVTVDYDIVGDDDPHLIIGSSNNGYVIKMPSNKGWTIYAYNVGEFGIEPGHEGERGWLVDGSNIIAKVGTYKATVTIPTANTSPLKCGTCGNFFPSAQSNLKDGGFACYSCRTDPRNMLGDKLLKG